MDKFSQIPQLSFGNKDAGMVGIWTKASILEHRHTQSLYLISKQNPLDRSCMLIGHAHQGSKPSQRPGGARMGKTKGISLCTNSHRKIPVMITGVPCNENRFLPLRISTQGKPCSGPFMAMYRIAVQTHAHRLGCHGCLASRLAPSDLGFLILLHARAISERQELMTTPLPKILSFL